MSKFFLTIISALLFMQGACAQELYSGEVSVEGQGEEERDEAVPSALIQVLQKLSGRRELPLTPALETALADANHMLVSFHYRPHDRSMPDGSVRSSTQGKIQSA